MFFKIDFFESFPFPVFLCFFVFAPLNFVDFEGVFVDFEVFFARSKTRVFLSILRCVFFCFFLFFCVFQN